MPPMLDDSLARGLSRGLLRESRTGLAERLERVRGRVRSRRLGPRFREYVEALGFVFGPLIVARHVHPDGRRSFAELLLWDPLPPDPLAAHRLHYRLLLLRLVRAAGMHDFDCRGVPLGLEVSEHCVQRLMQRAGAMDHTLLHRELAPALPGLARLAATAAGEDRVICGTRSGLLFAKLDGTGCVQLVTWVPEQRLAPVQRRIAARLLARPCAGPLPAAFVTAEARAPLAAREATPVEHRAFIEERRRDAPPEVALAAAHLA